jgi:hypothetical protein
MSMICLINLDVIPNIQSEAGPVGNVLSYDLLDGGYDWAFVYYHPLISSRHCKINPTHSKH